MIDVEIKGTFEDAMVAVARLTNGGEKYTITITDNNGDIDLTREQARWVACILNKLTSGAI